MRRDQTIRVNELLLEREALFLRIHRVEHEVARILGGDYPFPTVDLPSTRRTKRKVATTRPAQAAADLPAKPALALRRLEADENRYRVTYRQFSKVLVEEHVDFEAVRTLLACQSSDLEVQKIETLHSDGSVSTQLL
jgi:hypothetical protein